MKVLVTKLIQVRGERGQTIVLRPGERLDNREVSTPMEDFVRDEVANLKRVLGPTHYAELVDSGVLLEADGP